MGTWTTRDAKEAGGLVQSLRREQHMRFAEEHLATLLEHQRVAAWNLASNGKPRGCQTRGRRNAWVVRRVVASRPSAPGISGIVWAVMGACSHPALAKTILRRSTCFIGLLSLTICFTFWPRPGRTIHLGGQTAVACAAPPMCGGIPR